MPRGRSRSSRTLSERREFASELFTKGFTVSDVARKVDVSWDTAKSYKEWHEARVVEAAHENPQLLQDVLKNTIQSLSELDQVRAAAWRTYHTTESEQIKLQALNTIRQSGQDKAKLYGLFGVKQDFFAHVQNVNFVQSRLLDFMTRELCEEDRRKLEAFLGGEEFQRYLSQSAALPILELESEEVSV